MLSKPSASALFDVGIVKPAAMCTEHMPFNNQSGGKASRMAAYRHVEACPVLGAEIVSGPDLHAIACWEDEGSVSWQ